MFNINILSMNHGLQNVSPYDLIQNPKILNLYLRKREFRLLLSKPKIHLCQQRDG